MNVATVIMPSDWQPGKSDVKKCLEIYTLSQLKPFQVNIVGGGTEDRIDIMDFEKLDQDQQTQLYQAITKFNDAIMISSKDPCSTAALLRKDLEAWSIEMDASAFRTFLLNRAMKQY